MTDTMRTLVIDDGRRRGPHLAEAPAPRRVIDEVLVRVIVAAST